jgi:hypothetical protein
MRGSTNQTNKTAAQRHESNLRQKLADDRSGIIESDPPPPFSEFAEEFLKRTKHEMKPNTERSYKNCLENLKPVLEEFFRLPGFCSLADGLA